MRSKHQGQWLTVDRKERETPGQLFPFMCEFVLSSLAAACPTKAAASHFWVPESAITREKRKQRCDLGTRTQMGGVLREAACDPTGG